MTRQFWMIYVDGQRSPTTKHLTEEVALKEAERLALLPENKGAEVFVLVATSSCKYTLPVQWTKLENDDIPF